MGNCCSGSPTSSSNIMVPDEFERERPNSSVQPQNVGVADYVTADSMLELSLPAEPQQLEHIADREGMCVTSLY